MDGGLCKGLCPLHPQPPLGTVEGFALQERECSQGFKGGDFRRKYYPSLDGTERHTALAEGKATRLSLLPHGECGVWGNAPRVKFRDGVRLPFSKGKEDWGAVRRRRGNAPSLDIRISLGYNDVTAPCKGEHLLCRLVRYTYNKVGGISNGKEQEP